MEGVAFAFMTAYSTFMDASGKPENHDRYCVVAGLLSTVAQWDCFEVEWNELLVKHSIPYLQISSLHARKGIFSDKKWEDDNYMISFLNDAAKIIRGHTLKWAADVVGFDEFRKASQERPGLKRYANAYGICGTAVALRLQGDRLFENFPKKLSIEHFFEEGDKGVSSIAQVFSRCGMQQPIVRPGKPHKTDPSRRYYVHFQAADWLAFETKKVADKQDKTGKKFIRRCHRELLRGIPGEAKKWDYEDLIRFCDIKRARGQMS